MSSPPTIRAAVAVCTYKRPRLLAQALQSLLQLQTGEALSITYIIIDNDASQSAKEIVAEVFAGTDASVIYDATTEKGIPFARNLAITHALACEATYLACMDDDETADAAWLRELVSAAEAQKVDIVCGPKLPVFETSPAPQWMQAGKFYEKSGYAEGRQLSCADTGNILFHARVFKDNPQLRFDEKMANTGGTDTKLTRQLVQAGYRILWTNHAVVHDFVPASRMRLRWLLQRHFRNGMVRFRIERNITGKSAWLKIPLLALYHAAQGSLCILKSLVAGRSALHRGLLHFAEIMGMAAAFLGMHYHEYNKTHGQ